MNNNKYIIVRGACENNLKSVNVKIPKGKITVITGLSGSGKSSLAFGTIYAEGQRRYIESLSAYARQFLEMQSKPNVESIEGLSPSISIEQKSTSNNPRSTVGTVTEIYDYMRLLWARAGIAYSPVTGLPIEKQSVSQIVDKILNYDIGTKILILAPIVRQRKGEYKKELKELLSKGFQRVKIDGKIYQIDETPNLKKNIKHDIEVIVDRIIVKDGIQKRLSDSVETTLSLSDGLIIIEDMENGTQELLSEKFTDPYSDFTLPEITPRLFSFNSPVGACSTCSGIGTETDFDPDLIIIDKNLSLKDGAVEPWKGHSINKELLRSLCLHFDEKFDTPWNKLSEKLREAILFGTEKPIELKFYINKQLQVYNKRFEGVIPYLKRRFNDTTSPFSRDSLTNYQINKVCSECKGKRLKLEALCIKIADYNIDEASQLSIESAITWFKNISNKLTEQQKQISERILKEINRRLEFLSSVGLNYLTLNRTSGTLSGGESQRIRLASQIGSGLTGVLYVLDEPSIGLHQRDNERLLASLAHLRSLDNTVIVVEHDEDAIRFSDYLIDIGPGAGKNGGTIVASGTPAQVIKVKKSITAQYLNGTKKIEIPKKRRAGNGKKIDIFGAQANNLKNIDVSFPLGKFIAVTGVSGGGKSSLVIESLWKGIEKQLSKSNINTNAGKYEKILGVEHIDKVIDINQNPIGKTPRSNPVTYTGVFSYIRDWFAKLPEAKIRGYKTGRFSFNVKGGRCEICKGDGVIKIEMHFLPDIYVECEQCKAKRYNRETLEVMYKEKNIADVLDMTVDEALKFFEANPTVSRILKTLQDVGLGYIHLGQQATTLSGGEAQRIKLAKELSKRNTGNTLYILDEPTTGLHFEDIRQLLEVLNNLVDKGNTVIVIEHNLDVIKTADYIIDIGPEGGEHGGNIVAMGTPEQIVTCDKGHTTMYLKKYLNDI